MTLEEFCRRPLALTSRACPTRVRLDAAFKRAGLRPKICMELDEVSTIMSVVKAGGAVSLLPKRS
jgi:DNA-binding transcriptional LysR family regulator